MNKKLKNNAFYQFVNFHKDRKEFLSFIVIGSVVKPEIKIFNDVDCLVLTKREVSKKQLIHKTLNKFASFYNNESDDVLVFGFANLRVSCFYMSQGNFLDYINKILSAKFLEIRLKSWVVGGKIEEVLLGDIKLAKIFFDKTKKFIKLQNSLTVYPISFRIKLLNYLEKDIKSRLVLQKKTMKNNFLFSLGLHEIIISLIRYIYAWQKVYLLPLKHITAGIHSQCLPVKHRKTINILLKLPALKDKEKIINQLKFYISLLGL